MRVAALDVGGSRLKAGVVDGRDVTAPVVRPTSDLVGADVVSLIAESARHLAAAAAEVVAVALPGIVGERGIEALPGKFPGIVGIDIAAAVEEATGLPVTLLNDAVAAAVGEATHGAGAAHARVVCVTIGTGVGTAAVENGRPLGAGAWGGGQLAGQLPVSDGNDRGTDTSGRRGTLEALCRADALVAAGRAVGCEAETVEDLYRLWESGDPGAVAGVRRYRVDLARGLAALALAYTPDAIVVGGGPLSEDPRWLLDGLAQGVRPQLWPGQMVTIVPSSLGDAAGLVGAAAFAATVASKTARSPR